MNSEIKSVKPFNDFLDFPIIQYHAANYPKKAEPAKREASGTRNRRQSDARQRGDSRDERRRKE